MRIASEPAKATVAGHSAPQMAGRGGRFVQSVDIVLKDAFGMVDDLRDFLDAAQVPVVVFAFSTERPPAVLTSAQVSRNLASTL